MTKSLLSGTLFKASPSLTTSTEFATSASLLSGVIARLVGGPKSPRDAMGAKAFVTTGGIRQRGDVFSGGSYASSSDQRLHFGLGAATKVDKLEIHWPGGAKEQIMMPAVDRIYTVVEGKGIVER